MSQYATAHRTLPAILTGWLAIFVILYETFGGVLRYMLADIGALFVNNIPSIGAVLLLVSYYPATGLRRMPSFMIGVGIWAVVFILYALVNPLSAMQSMFGFYIWALALLGILVCVYAQEQLVFRVLPLAWGCAVTGVILNKFVDFPWVGANYQAHGMQMEMSRQWWAAGIDRLAGFSRASFSAASTIVIGLSYILATHRFNLIFKIAAYGLSGVALYLTTSKNELLIFVAMPVIFGIYKIMKRAMPDSRLPVIYARCVPMAMMALVVLVPLTMTTNWLLDVAHVGFFSSDSMIDRVLNTWPDAFRLLDRDGNFFLGRGIGGIGAPQLTGEPEQFTFADNLFVYLFVSGGLFLTVPIMGAFFRASRLLAARPDVDEIFLLSFCLLGIGLTNNVLEAPTTALWLGFLVARASLSPPSARR